MRLLLLGLVLLNIGLYVVFDQHSRQQKAKITAAAEISPEKIIILTERDLDLMPKRVNNPAPALIIAPAVTLCYEWGIFTGANVSRAESAVNNLNLTYTVKQATTREAKRFWVYRQPLRTTEEAQATVAELKAMGIEDLFVVQEPTWRNAISFGVFTDEKLATKLRNDLQARGVKNVIKALRNQGNNPVSFIFNNMTEAEFATLKTLQPGYADTKLNEVSCQS